MNFEKLKTKCAAYRDIINNYHLTEKQFSHPVWQVIHVICPSIALCSLISLVMGTTISMLIALMMLFYWFNQMQRMDMGTPYCQQNGILLFLVLTAHIFTGRSVVAELTFLLFILPFVSYLVLSKNPKNFLKYIKFESFKEILDKQIYKTDALDDKLKKLVLPALLLLYAILWNVPLLLI